MVQRETCFVAPTHRIVPDTLIPEPSPPMTNNSTLKWSELRVGMVILKLLIPFGTHGERRKFPELTLEGPGRDKGVVVHFSVGEQEEVVWPSERLRSSRCTHKSRTQWIPVEGGGLVDRIEGCSGESALRFSFPTEIQRSH